MFDRKAAEEEESEMVKKNPKLKGKSRTEMGLKPFEGTEIRSAVMGMEISITADIIARVCRCENTGLYQVEAVKSQWEDKVNEVLYQGNAKGKSSELSHVHKVFKKILSECIFQKGGGTDAPSLDHKVVMYCLATYQRINLPKYILHHMCWALKESQKKGRRQIPFGRLLYEIFVQGKLLKYLRETGVSSDEELGTVVGKIINGKTLKSMKLIDDVVTSKEDLAVETVQSDLMTDFLSISKEENPEVLYQFIKAHFELTGTIISVASIPEKIGGTPLKVKGKRSRKESKVEVAALKPKKSKSNVSASEEAAASEEGVQKQKNKKSDVREAAQTIRRKRSRNLKTTEGRMEEFAEQLGAWEEEPSPKP